MTTGGHDHKGVLAASAVTADPAGQPPAEDFPLKHTRRLQSIDAFRGLTILGMIFVIQVAGYTHLPLTFRHFGSEPVSTWKHAGESEPTEWDFWDAGAKTPSTDEAAKNTEYEPSRHFTIGKVTSLSDLGKPSVAILSADAKTTYSVQTDVVVWAARPPVIGDTLIVHSNTRATDWKRGSFSYQTPGNGVTITDLVAPFFVFIVGVCIPLSRASRASGWWRHSLQRSGFLVLAGVVYISLILKLSWWWGILQAIGVAYLLGSVFMQVPALWRMIVLLGICAFHQWATWHIPGWVRLGDPSKPFFTIATWREGKPADMLRPLTLHCTPWGSIGYGICTVIGTIVGEALATRIPSKVARSCFMVAAIGIAAGLTMHFTRYPMNKDCVSVSYALFTSGVGAAVFWCFYWVIDVCGVRRWAWPLTVFGANALLAYFLQVIVRMTNTSLGIQPFFVGHAGWTGIIWGLIWTAELWLATLFCNKRNIYWKL